MNDKKNTPGIEYSKEENSVFNKHQDAENKAKALLGEKKSYQKYKYNFERPLNVIPASAELASQLYVDAVNQSVIKSDALVDEEKKFLEENKL